MALTNPGQARLNCTECRRWLHDVKTGEPLLRGGAKQARPRDVPTPCFECPKKSPREAPKYELTVRNLRAVHVYLQGRATQWRGVPQQRLAEPWFSRAMAIVDRVMRDVEREAAALELANLLSITGSPRVKKGRV